LPELATDKVFANKQIGGVTYTVVVKPIGFDVKSMLWDLMSNMFVDRRGRQGADVQLGTVRDAVFFNGIRKLEVEGKEIELRRDYALKDLPMYRDREYMNMDDRLLEHIVEVNDFLGFEEPFGTAFARYLPENLREEENPTQSGEEIKAAQQDTPPVEPPTEPEEQPTPPRIPAVQR
jgi:hypothetical protein